MGKFKKLMATKPPTRKLVEKIHSSTTFTKPPTRKLVSGITITTITIHSSRCQRMQCGLTHHRGVARRRRNQPLHDFSILMTIIIIYLFLTIRWFCHDDRFVDVVMMTIHDIYNSEISIITIHRIRTTSKKRSRFSWPDFPFPTANSPTIHAVHLAISSFNLGGLNISTRMLPEGSQHA